MTRARISLAALGSRIARAAGSGWRAVEAAGSPNDTALLALAEQLTPADRTTLARLLLADTPKGEVNQC